MGEQPVKTAFFYNQRKVYAPELFVDMHRLIYMVNSSKAINLSAPTIKC